MARATIERRATRRTAKPEDKAEEESRAKAFRRTARVEVDMAAEPCPNIARKAVRGAARTEEERAAASRSNIAHPPPST